MLTLDRADFHRTVVLLDATCCYLGWCYHHIGTYYCYERISASQADVNNLLHALESGAVVVLLPLQRMRMFVAPVNASREGRKRRRRRWSSAWENTNYKFVRVESQGKKNGSTQRANSMMFFLDRSSARKKEANSPAIILFVNAAGRHNFLKLSSNDIIAPTHTCTQLTFPIHFI